MNLLKKVIGDFDLSSVIAFSALGLIIFTADSYSHYRELVGHIHGIEWSREIFTSIVKRRIYEEEE